MPDVIIYAINGQTAIAVPTAEALQTMTLEQIAARDVPAGATWAIADAATLPQPAPAPPYNPNAFKVALLGDPLWNAWEDALEPVANRIRENLKLAAIANDWPTVQGLYLLAAAAVAPPAGAIEQWQALADATSIPLDFQTQ